MKVSVLGTAYIVCFHTEEQDEKLKTNYGYCDKEAKMIVINKSLGRHYTAVTLRHELYHAFLYESGLDSSSLHYESGWATNEEMVDWLAIQYPKIKKVFDKLGI